MPLSGETPPNRTSPVAEILIICVFMSPVFLIVGFIVWKIIESLIEQEADPTAVVGAPIALILICVFISRMRWTFWTVPRLTISSFVLDDADNLNFTTLRDGNVVVPAGNLVSMKRQLGHVETLHGRNRRMNLTRGWWIRFRQTGWLYLPSDNSFANELIGRLSKAKAEN